MFGYVKPFVPELKVAQYEIYRAAYCGLCRAMGNVTGQTSRLTLSYDLVMLAAVRLILEEIEPEFEKHTCFAHPMKKRLIMKDNAALSFTAAMSAVLADAKNADDLADESGMKRMRAVLVSPYLRVMTGRAKKNLPEDTDEKIRSLLGALTELERARCSSADEAAEAFGKTLALAFSIGLSGEKEDIASQIGRSVGRFIYLCDAADDMTEDIRKNRYNPIALGWGELATDPESGGMSDIVKESIKTSAPIDLEVLGEAAEKLDESHVMTPIIKNIVYLGLPDAMDKVLGLTGEKYIPSDQSCPAASEV